MTVLQNNPLLWLDKLPRPEPRGHKYGRGVAVIYGAPKMTGATRLAARAAARMGAGLVRVIAPAGTGEIYRATLHEEIIVEDAADFKGFGDSRIGAILMGPGCPAEPLYAGLLERIVSERGGAPCAAVLDAGAFLCWADRAGDFKALASRMLVAVTPHEGEFASFFKGTDVLSGTKEDQARKAYQALGATVLLKGAQSVIAGGEGLIVQNRDIPALSTGGTGDVLAGMIAGLAAQGMELRLACAAAAHIHAEAAVRFGAGLVASDLPDMIPSVLQDLLKE